MDPTDTGDASLSAKDVGEQVLKYFWDLASLEEAARASAAKGLVTELKASQAEHTKANSASDSLSPALVYGLKRLVRGLASGRQGARQGYALALTTLMSEVSTLPVTMVLDMLDKTLEVSGQAKGPEAHDQLLGRGFGYAAAIRAGQIQDIQLAVRCATALIGIANKKSFLRELAVNALLELTDKLDATAVAVLVKEAGLKAWLCYPAPEAHPEALLLALRLWSKLPTDLLPDMSLLPGGAKPPPEDFFTTGQGTAALAAAAVFSQQHLQQLLPVLRSSSSSHPRLHSVWLTLLALLLPGFTAVKDVEAATEQGAAAGTKGAPNSSQLQGLWDIVVEALFQSSHERKALGFQLFTILLPHLHFVTALLDGLVRLQRLALTPVAAPQPQDIPTVFSRSFLRCWMNNLTKGNTYLHNSAQRCVQRLSNFMDKAKATPGMQVALAVALQNVGNQGFDKLSNTRLVANLLKRLDESELKLYVKQLQKQFVVAGKADAAQDDQDAEKVRQRAVEQMCGVANIRNAPPAIKSDVLKFMAVHALFAVDKSAYAKGKPKELKLASEVKPAVAPETRQLCAGRLISLIDAVSKAAATPDPPAGAGGPGKGKTKKRKAAEMEATAAAAGAAAAEAVLAARLESAYLAEIPAFVSKVQATDGVSFGAEVSDEVEEALSKLRKTEALLMKTNTEDSNGGQQQQARALLALVRWLQLYLLADPASMDLDVAADLQGVFAGAFTKAKPVEGEPAWMDVLVDILLSLLGRAGDALPFHPLREACEALFRAFAEQVTPQGFEDLIRVVQQTSESPDKEEDDEEMFEDEGEDEEQALKEVDDGDEQEADVDTAGSEERSSTDEDVDSEASEKGDESASDEEDFNDEQMFAMDSKIAAALKVMAKGGANARESREAIQNFKFRVIGLIEIFIRKVPNSSLLAGAVTPLLTALTAACQQGGSPPLAARLHALLMALSKGQAQAPSTAGADAPSLEGQAGATVLRRTLYLASRHKEKKVAGAATMAFIYLLRSSVTSEGKPSTEAQAAAKAAVDDFFDKKKSRLHRKLFEDIMVRSPQLGVAAVLPAVAQHAQQARNGFARADAIALLASFLVKEQQRSADGPRGFAERGPLIAELAVTAITGDVAQTARQTDALKAICSCFESLKKVYPETIVKLLGSTQGQSLKTTLAETLAAGCKNKVEAQMKRLSKVLLNSSTVSSSAKGPAKSEKSESKANKKKLRAEKKAERKNKGKKLRPNGSV